MDKISQSQVLTKAGRNVPLSSRKIRPPVHKRDGQEPLRILIVDDEEPIREMIGLFLGKKGYRPFTADGGEKALAIFAAESIDLVLTDLKMAPMDGFELLGNIRKIDIDVPVILISGDRDLSLPYRAFQEGADDFLRKPFSFETLLESIERCRGETRMELLMRQVD